MKDRHGEHIFCELPNGTVCSLPAWMFRPESTQFALGPPLISVDALTALRDLIEVLQSPQPCGRASLNQSPKEGVNEATSNATQQAVQPAAAGAPAAALPDGAQRKLSRALVELLVSAARESVSHPIQGGGNESKVDE